MLKFGTVQLDAFEPEDGQTIAKWFYDPYYKNYFRHIPRLIPEKEFANYPAIGNGYNYMLRENGKTVGAVQVSYDVKTNKAVHLGLLIDKEYSGKKQSHPIFIGLLDWLFNTGGFRKAIVEVLASHKYIVDVLDNTGWTKEATLQQECFLNGEYVDEFRYCMFADTFNMYKREGRI